MNRPPRQLQVQIELPLRTIFAILITLFLIHLVEGLSPLLMPLFVGSLLAVGLHPILVWMECRRVPSWLAVLIMVLGLSALMVGIVAALIAQLVTEFSN